MRYCLICKRCYDDEASFCEAEGAQTATIMPGSRILDEKYEIERLLGQGGMGAVFEALQRGIERKVAVKLINPSFVSNEQSLERFKREALACGRVKHPNAITVYDFGVTKDGMAYLAMEFLCGRSLRDELSKVRVIEPERTVEILAAVCAAVESAHRQNIVHRDLKPDNIFLESLDDGTVTPKVLDFGIAKLRTAQPGAPDLTGEGSSIGTPAYMSPEQAKGLHLDARSDVYALGVIAYEMLSGSLPFQSTSPMGFLVQHMMEAPIPLSAACPTISQPVEQAVMSALEKSPDARPQSALEFGRLLASAVAAKEGAAEARPAGFQETVAFVRKLGSETIAMGRSTVASTPVLGWPVGVAPGVEPGEAADAFAELARELVAAAAQRVPYEIVLRGAQRWAERRLSARGLQPPQVVGTSEGVSPKSAGLAFYCTIPSLSWVARMPSGAELPLLLRTDESEEPYHETVPGVASYYVSDLPGGQVVALIARQNDQLSWSDAVALVDGATALVLCVEKPDPTATQNPEMFAHLFGTVEVACNESGADILVDDGPVPWGNTVDDGPSLLYCVVPGTHRIVVRKEFYVSFAADVEVKPGERAALRANLVRAESSLTLSGNMPGLNVEIRGPEPSPEVQTVILEEPGRLRSVTLPAGSYVVKTALPGYAEWKTQLVARDGIDQRVEIALHPVLCPLCGKPAGTDTFLCPACQRDHIHAFHEYDQGRCIECAARASFDKAKVTGTIEAWRSFMDAFRSANPALTRQAELETRRLVDHAREQELAQRAERFSRLAAQNAIGEVIVSLQRAVAERPGEAEGHLALGMAYEATGDRKTALAAFHAAAERSPSDPFVQRECARLLAVMRMDQDAVRAYSRAVSLKPDFADAHFELANLLAKIGQVDSAIEGFRTAAAYRPTNPVFHEAHARALAERGRFREAHDAYYQAVRCYRRDANHEQANRVEQLARQAMGQTALYKAGRMIKGLFE